MISDRPAADVAAGLGIDPGLLRLWVSDNITYIKTRLGWVYLAAVMGLYSRAMSVNE